MFGPLNGLMAVMPLIGVLVLLVAGWSVGVGASLLLSVFTVWLLIYALRVPFRYQVALPWRRSRTGELVWFKVRPNSRKIPGSEADRSRLALDAVRSALNQTVAGVKFTSLASRGTLSAVIVKAPGVDGGPPVVRFYIAVTASAVRNAEGAIASLASALGGDASRCRAPKLPHGRYAVARTMEIQTTAVTDGHSTIVRPAAEMVLGEESFTGYVVLSVEGVRASEGRRLQAFITESAEIATGDAAQYSGRKHQEAELFASSASRTSQPRATASRTVAASRSTT